MTRSTRTVEEIRKAARAEVAGLRQAAARIAALERELRLTPEHRQRAALEDEDEGAEVNICPYYLGGTLADAAKELRQQARQLEEETSPKWWAAYPAEWLGRRTIPVEGS